MTPEEGILMGLMVFRWCIQKGGRLSPSEKLDALQTLGWIICHTECKPESGNPQATLSEQPRMRLTSR